jgi:hypothetical protein
VLECALSKRTTKEVFMLKKLTVICGLLLAATVTMAWQQLDDVPSPAVVDTGTHITWGAGVVWGVFPTRDTGGDPETYAAYYDTVTHWHLLDESMEYDYLYYTGLTFQWQETPTPFGIGATYDDDDSAYYPALYSYSTSDSVWDCEDIEDFSLGRGTCIAYVPNAGWDVDSYAVPGWIYCLPGEGKEFWRYNIPAEISDISQYGYYPGPSATIADQTPPFEWSPYASPTQYRIQVSTNPYFMGNVIDTIVCVPEYEPTTKLANGTYYWRSAYRIGMTWSWSGTHSFFLQGGWERLVDYDVPQDVGRGAAMAYDGDAFGNSSLIVLPGAGSRDFYRYDLQAPSWYHLADAPKGVHAGTSLTTHDPTGEWSAYPCAAFGDADTSDCPYHYHTDRDTWVPFDTTDNDPLWYSHFPEPLGPEASMVGGTNHMDYLVVGDSNHFYRLEPPAEAREGGQAGVMQNGSVNAHVVCGLDRVEVEYQLPASAHVRATLHDAVGRRVGALDADEQKPGVHRLAWNRDGEGRKLSAGAYFVLLDMGKEKARLKAVVR